LDKLNTCVKSTGVLSVVTFVKAFRVLLTCFYTDVTLHKISNLASITYSALTQQTAAQEQYMTSDSAHFLVTDGKLLCCRTRKHFIRSWLYKPWNTNKISI